MKVPDGKNSDGVRAYHKKESDGVRGDHEKKNDGDESQP